MLNPRGLLPTARAAVLIVAARGLRGRVRVDREARRVRALARLPLGRSRLAARTIAAHRRLQRLPLLNCLDRSIALWADLESAGHPASLRFGVRSAPTFEAHAWVELEGEVATGDASFVAAFAPFVGDLGARFVEALS